MEAPAQTPAARSRTSKLERFKPTIAELLEKDARASAAVIEQRLRPLGYDGGHSILRDYIHKVRPQPQHKRAFVAQGARGRRTLRGGGLKASSTPLLVS